LENTYSLLGAEKGSMESEASNPGILKRYRYLILTLMVIASLVSALMRFSGDWSHFWTVLTVQAWFMQAVFAYLRGGCIVIGPGGLSRDAAPLGRSALAATAFVFYLLVFAYGSDHADSVHERRASDWTMPTREEIGRASE
jgi:hypothetical protein